MTVPKAKRAYRQQQHNAIQRGIGWHLTFAEWWAIWEQSGHYSERGVRVGQYCMQRFYDRGDYVVGNVEIGTVTANQRTRILGKWQRRVGKTDQTDTRLMGRFYPSIEDELTGET